MDLHAQLEPLRPLIGTWRGAAFGQYPTITSFEYTEELTFTNVGKPFLAYEQRTWSLSGQAMHMETGYLRLPAPRIIEFTLAQPTGQTELAEGTMVMESGELILAVRGKVMNTATAKIVEATEREYRLSGDRLATSFAMAAVGQSMTNHLSSHLIRVSD